MKKLVPTFPRRLAPNSPDDADDEGVVTLDAAKSYLRVDTGDIGDDELIEALIEAATRAAEDRLGRSLLTTRWALALNDFTGDSAGRLRLRKPDVVAIESIVYRDASGGEQTVDHASFRLNEDVLGGYIKGIQSWPTPDDNEGAVTITFTAGYGAADVPVPIRQAILLMIGDMYEHRETAVVGANAYEVPVSTTVSALLAPYMFNSAIA